jgi:2,3-bisphosphoglycerate-dependent phosphoglycerate mutase
MAYLILIRHGKSEWNKLGLWTGWTDVSLAEEGIEEARLAGLAIKDFHIDCVHVSTLKRAHETWHEIKNVLSLAHDPKRHNALNERHYGIHTGKNKWEVKKAIGEEEFQRIRRSWNHPIPEGETMKDVHDRVVPYYTEHILPELRSGKNVLVVGHGNNLRALVKHLENLTDDGISDLEYGTGEVYCYEFDMSGKIVGKQIRAANPDKLKV